MKIIKIENCSQCHHNDIQSAINGVSCIPVCRLASREQPYETYRSGRGFLKARQTVDIPDWCPLEEYNPSGVSS